MRDRLEVTRSNSGENHPLAYHQSDHVACVIKQKKGNDRFGLFINHLFAFLVSFLVRIISGDNQYIVVIYIFWDLMIMNCYIPVYK